MSKRYSAKLAFYYDNRRDCTVSICEERIVCFVAQNTKQALKSAKRIGKGAEYEFENSSAELISFEFIGIMDILELGIECDDEEVWYDVKRRKVANMKAKALSDTQALSRLEKNNQAK